MTKSPDKETKDNGLQFAWDPEEHSYCVKEDSRKKGQDTPRRLEDYLEFLADAEPACTNSFKQLLADQQFTL